jgi:hypothetical protein
MKKFIVLLITVLMSISVYAAGVKIIKIDSGTKGILQLNLKLGQHVNKGQLLFIIETKFNNSAKNRLFYAKNVYDRDKKLFKRISSISKARLEREKYYYIDALADYRKIIISNKKSYYSPSDGTVSEIRFANSSSIRKGDVIMNITASMTMYKANVVKIDSASEGILQLNIKLDQHVEKGQLLFTTETELDRVDMLKIKNRLVYTKSVYDRYKKLVELSIYSKVKLEKIKFDYINALADYKKKKISNKKSCYSPCDGLVSKIIFPNGSSIGKDGIVINITTKIV